MSLVRTLLPAKPAEDDIALYFDVDQKQFVPPPSAATLGQDPGRWLPATVLVDSERLFQWLLKYVPEPRRRETAVQLGKRIREYDVPAYIVKTDSETVLREVFGRVNNFGKRLDEEQVFEALHGDRQSAAPAAFTQVVSDLEQIGFGRIDTKILYRLLRVLLGHDVAGRPGDGPLRLGKVEAREAYAVTARVANEVLRFLKRDGGFIHYDLMPYKQPLVTLGRFFQLHPSPNARSRELLVRWLWRGALTGAHRGDVVSTGRALEQIQPGSEEGSVQRLLKNVPSEPSNLPRTGDAFNFRYASSKLQVLALLEAGPLHLETGDPIVLGDLLDRRIPDTEPPLLAVVAASADARQRTIANRVVHGKGQVVRKALIAATPEVRKSHLVDERATELLAAGADAEFLQYRSGVMDHHFQQFFRRRARWGESDRPSMAYLMIPDEHKDD